MWALLPHSSRPIGSCELIGVRPSLSPLALCRYSRSLCKCMVLLAVLAGTGCWAADAELLTDRIGCAVRSNYGRLKLLDRSSIR